MFVVVLLNYWFTGAFVCYILFIFCMKNLFIHIVGVKIEEYNVKSMYETGDNDERLTLN